MEQIKSSYGMLDLSTSHSAGNSQRVIIDRKFLQIMCKNLVKVSLTDVKKNIIFMVEECNSAAEIENVVLTELYLQTIIHHPNMPDGWVPDYTPTEQSPSAERLMEAL